MESKAHERGAAVVGIIGKEINDFRMRSFLHLRCLKLVAR